MGFKSKQNARLYITAALFTDGEVGWVDVDEEDAGGG